MARISQRFRSWIAAPREFIWQCYVRDGMFERLSPPWQGVRTLQRHGGVAPGDWRLVRITMGPVAMRWKATHFEWQPGYLFTDEQTEGPFAYWRHEHYFDEGKDGTCILGDRVTYSLPASPLSHWLGEPVARREVWRMFAYRHLISKLDIDRHLRYRGRPRLPIVISGTPLDAVRQLEAFLAAGGHSAVSRATQAPEHGDTGNSAAKVEINLGGRASAQVSLTHHGDGEVSRSAHHPVHINPGEMAALMRVASGHDPMFRNPDEIGRWALREALFSAIYRSLMDREDAGPQMQ